MEKLSQVLIIDGDPLTAYLHKTFIKKSGISHQIKSATNGNRALQGLKSCIRTQNEDKLPQLLVLEKVNSWQKERNQKQVKAKWQFTTKDARIKLKKLYPTN